MPLFTLMHHSEGHPYVHTNGTKQAPHIRKGEKQKQHYVKLQNEPWMFQLASRIPNPADSGATTVRELGGWIRAWIGLTKSEMSFIKLDTNLISSVLKAHPFHFRCRRRVWPVRCQRDALLFAKSPSSMGDVCVYVCVDWPLSSRYSPSWIRNR